MGITKYLKDDVMFVEKSRGSNQYRNHLYGSVLLGGGFRNGIKKKKTILLGLKDNAGISEKQYLLRWPNPQNKNSKHIVLPSEAKRIRTNALLS